MLPRRQVAPDAPARRVYAVETHLAALLRIAAETDARSYSAFGSTFHLPLERHFGDLDGVRRYLDGVLNLPAVQERWPEAVATGVTVGESRADADPGYRRGRIYLHPHATKTLRELVVLHELAHHLGGGGHGTRFREAFIEIVELVLGAELALLLRIYLVEGVGEGEP